MVDYYKLTCLVNWEECRRVRTGGGGLGEENFEVKLLGSRKHKHCLNMTGNKDENIQGVAGEGSKPVSIMNVKLYSGTDAKILHFIDYDFYD